jgi:carbohydrate-selective porin OprB
LSIHGPLAAIGLLAAATAWADPPPPRLTGTWGGARTNIEERGFTVIGAYTGEVMGRVSGERRAVFAGLVELGLDLDLTVAEPRAGKLHVYGYGVHGEGLTDTGLDDVHGVSNIVADPELRLFEAWYDQPFDNVSVRIGLSSADQEFLVVPHGLALMNTTFGIPAQATLNLGGPVYPVATLAGRVRIDARDVSVKTAVFDGEQANDHGIPTALGESALFFLELAWREMLTVGAWVHTDHPDAVYAMFDSELGGGWASFVRLSLSPGGPGEIYADAGLVMPGARKADRIALGVAVTDGERREVLVEATYLFMPVGWLVLQPDVQWVWNERHDLVVGLRAVIDL